ncbi:MAG: hypothetical protein QME51_10155, partial [Planctomycetota bacterium]|nr:hypothetical protein [Planctomycetota bacterium]
VECLPAFLPSGWRVSHEDFIPEKEIKGIRLSVKRCRPFGSAGFIEKIGNLLGVDFQKTAPAISDK